MADDEKINQEADEQIDEKRRKFLSRATATVGVAGIVAAGIPFAASMMPSEEAKAAGAPVKVNIGSMKPGDQLTVLWRGFPVWIVYRTTQMLEELKKITNELRDPDSKIEQQPEYAQNLYRSIKPEILVLVGVCTHLGCTPTYRPEPHAIDRSWPGGFFCTCHGSKFDMSGRVFKGVPAPINLEVPPYVFLNEEEILIGTSDAPKEGPKEVLNEA